MTWRGNVASAGVCYLASSSGRMTPQIFVSMLSSYVREAAANNTDTSSACCLYLGGDSRHLAAAYSSP